MRDALILGLFVAALWVLVRASGWLVGLLTWMARYLRLSGYVVAFLLMAAATSIPELFVGVNAALSGIPKLSLGNILGANLLNVTLVLAVAALFRPIVLTAEEQETHEIRFIFALTLIPAIFFLDGALSRAEGAVLVILFLAYLQYLVSRSRAMRGELNAILPTPQTFRIFAQKMFLFLGGALLLLLASRAIVYAAGAGAARFGVPAFIIGWGVLSFGTTLPEITFGVRSTFSGHAGMSVGNVIGSVMFNLLFILGVVAMIHPITLAGDRGSVYASLLAVTAITLILGVIIRVFGKIGRGTALFLLALYAAVIFAVSQLSFHVLGW